MTAQHGREKAEEVLDAIVAAAELGEATPEQIWIEALYEWLDANSSSPHSDRGTSDSTPASAGPSEGSPRG